MRRIDTKVDNDHAPWGALERGLLHLKPNILLSLVLSYSSLVIHVRDCGDLDHCVNDETPSASCKEHLAPITLKLLKIRTNRRKGKKFIVSFPL